MVSLSLRRIISTTFLILPLLLSLHVSWSSCAQIGPAMEENLVLQKNEFSVSAAASSSSLTVQEVVHDRIFSTAAEVSIEGSKKEMKTRKMMLLGDSKVKRETSTGTVGMPMMEMETETTTKSSSSGAKLINYVGKNRVHHRGKKMISGGVDCNEFMRCRSPRRHRSVMRVKMGGFVAFNADYHMAKPHPPRNN